MIKSSFYKEIKGKKHLQERILHVIINYVVKRVIYDLVEFD